MGLPSGLQWANCNVGAEWLVDTGQYFSWGNVEGHRIGEGYDFSQSEYETTPAEAIAQDLSLSQDAARVNLGEPWRMPTAEEFQELYDNCTSVWTSLNGVNGYLFTSNINGKKIFFPAAGTFKDKALLNRGSRGRYWSSTYRTGTTARNLRFDSSGSSPQAYIDRYYGFPVRAVYLPE